MKIKIKQPEPKFIPTQKQSSPSTSKQSIISKALTILLDDINYYIHGIRSKDRIKWEEYQKFCELSRGK